MKVHRAHQEQRRTVRILDQISHIFHLETPRVCKSELIQVKYTNDSVKQTTNGFEQKFITSPKTLEFQIETNRFELIEIKRNGLIIRLYEEDLTT